MPLGLQTVGCLVESVDGGIDDGGRCSDSHPRESGTFASKPGAGAQSKRSVLDQSAIQAHRVHVQGSEVEPGEVGGLGPDHIDAAFGTGSDLYCSGLNSFRQILLHL
jgi:hypothetical protein